MQKILEKPNMALKKNEGHQSFRLEATHLKRNKRFDNFIMLVWAQGSPFHIAAGSHPVQEAWGSQDSLYRGQIQKLLQ